MPESLCLLVEVPVCAFRPYASREYQDTYPVPSPASVYGMLLSLLGVPREDKNPHRLPGVPREDKGRHRGAELALAVEALPPRSKVFRKLRRGDDLENMRPDYQDVLTDLRLWVWVRRGTEPVQPCLADRLGAALLERFAAVTRTGGVSLGENSYLVNAVSAASPPAALVFVTPDPTGFYSLPIWVDHAAAANTQLARFRIDEEARPVAEALPLAWFRIPLPPPKVEPTPAKRSRRKP